VMTIRPGGERRSGLSIYPVIASILSVRGVSRIISYTWGLNHGPEGGCMLELISEHRCFGGWQRFYRHQSSVIGLPMRFSVFIPAQGAQGKVPALFYLAGLTCTEETFMIKGGAQRYAAGHGIMLIAPDTSPRDANLPGETDAWDFGAAAGFYAEPP